MSIKSKIGAAIAAASPALAFAQESGGTDFTYTTPPGLQRALDTATATAEGMAGDVLPVVVTILFAFAGLVGIWLIWRVFKRGAGGR